MKINKYVETVNKRLDKARKNLKADKKYQEEIDLLEKIKTSLENGISARAIDYTKEEQELVKDMFLLTTKPILYIANVSEEQIEDPENDENVKKVIGRRTDKGAFYLYTLIRTV